MFRILIIEDDTTIAAVLADHLKKWAYETKVVEDFAHVTDIFAAYEPHLVLMDISLPYFSGYHWCTEIRKRSKVPIIFISSAEDNMSLVMAMNMGGDDFIPKPFDLTVVTAKVQAMLRRTYAWQNQTDLLVCGPATLDLNKNVLVYREQTQELSKNEFRILQCLMSAKGDTVSRDRLMESLWESESFIDDNTLTVNMTRLRKKLTDIGLNDFILTKKGLGYKVNCHD